MTTLDPTTQAVVAVDFGTARSGYLFTLTGDPAHAVYGEDQWPHQRYGDIKTPTYLLYSPADQVAAWGSEAWAALPRLRRERALQGYHFLREFKLRLHDGEGSADGPTLRAEDGKGFPVVHLIAEYLRRLKEAARKKLDNLNAGVREGNLLWCLTVPAGWSDLDKQWMRVAARRAGLIGPADDHRLVLVLEPEAAALYCLRRDSDLSLNDLQPGKRFMVVDAGGGTIDVTAYAVCSGGCLEEIIPAAGRPHGSTSINDDFVRHLAGRLGQAVIKDFRNEAPVEWFKLLDDWERVKCTYQSGPQEDWEVEFPSRLADILKEKHKTVYNELRSAQKGDLNYLILNREAMGEIFRRALDGVAATVRRQFDRLAGRRCDYLFVVGGFGACEVLQQRLKEEFGPAVSKVVIPPNPAEAVLRGAVEFGLHPARVQVRCSPLTYGCRIVAPWRPGDPPEKRVRKGGFDGCRDRFHAFVREGDAIDYHHRVTCRFLPVTDDQQRATLAFFRSAQREVEFVDQDGVEHAAELRLQLPEAETGQDRRVEVSMYFGRTEIAVEARALGGDGEVDARLDFRDGPPPAGG
jgi:molecular chaperone DnaK (HSP70)